VDLKRDVADEEQQYEADEEEEEEEPKDEDDSKERPMIGQGEIVNTLAEDVDVTVEDQRILRLE
jgi:hypothetical protein